MSAARFFVEGNFATGETLDLAGGDAHKIVDVLRKRSGDSIEIVDSSAQRFSATLQIEGRSVRARLDESYAPVEKQGLEITVAQGLPKGQKMDFVVEKVTELGAAAILPLYSERTIVSDAGQTKLDRWRRLAKSAAAQCGRDRIPEIAEPQKLENLLESFSSYDTVLFPWELAEPGPLRDVLPGLLENARRVLVVVGPEGGFSHAEAEAAQRAGAQLISLGSRILRTETAALVTVAMLNYVSGV
jgi:16S rRNA (uracil1498-N3)-methyltransferase